MRPILQSDVSAGTIAAMQIQCRFSVAQEIVPKSCQRPSHWPKPQRLRAKLFAWICFLTGPLMGPLEFPMTLEVSILLMKY